MIIVNKTPHDVIIYDETETRVIKTYPPDGLCTRLKVEFNHIGYEEGVEIVEAIVKEVNNLPMRREGYCYIVSQMVKTNFPDRDDFLVPVRVVKERNGEKVGCKALGK